MLILQGTWQHASAWRAEPSPRAATATLEPSCVPFGHYFYQQSAPAGVSCRFSPHGGAQVQMRGRGGVRFPNPLPRWSIETDTPKHRAGGSFRIRYLIYERPYRIVQYLGTVCMNRSSNYRYVNSNQCELQKALIKSLEFKVPVPGNANKKICVTLQDSIKVLYTVPVTYSATQNTVPCSVSMWQFQSQYGARLFHSRFCFNAKRNPLSRVADLHYRYRYFNADPDPAFHSKTDPVLDPDPVTTGLQTLVVIDSLFFGVKKKRLSITTDSPLQF